MHAYKLYKRSGSPILPSLVASLPVTATPGAFVELENSTVQCVVVTNHKLLQGRAIEARHQMDEQEARSNARKHVQVITTLRR